MPPADQTPARVQLFTRTGCHLCDDARDLVRRVCAEVGATWSEVDVDAPAPDGGSIREEYGELVPVVEVDGVRQGYWQIDEGRVRAALAERARRS
ncbi:glutaredoxin family protein [Cellulomonas timonensis]|uniref:glutaredoxin family protein n=1 Tax=Cellulomonas timonensis TaxID=1689271 RepID=UPI000B17F835|nr:glutaredoxin family protein [Cellulomonas timonensis]